MDKKVNTKFFAKEYKAKNWKEYVECFPQIDRDCDIPEVMPDDVLRVLFYLLGIETTKEWINSEMYQLDNRKPIDVVEDSEGLKALKALKALIMRLPT